MLLEVLAHTCGFWCQARRTLPGSRSSLGFNRFRTSFSCQRTPRRKFEPRGSCVKRLLPTTECPKHLPDSQQTEWPHRDDRQSAQLAQRRQICSVEPLTSTTRTARRALHHQRTKRVLSFFVLPGQRHPEQQSFRLPYRHCEEETRAFQVPATLSADLHAMTPSS